MATSARPSNPSPDPAPPILTFPSAPRRPLVHLRSFTPSLAPSLSSAANNHAIWSQLRDRLPHPYTLADANAWVARCQDPANWPGVLTFDPDGKETAGEKKCCSFAITTSVPSGREGRESGEECIGSVGLVMGSDVARRTAELGYWLAEPYWGKGIMGAVVPGLLKWAWEAFPGLVRVHAEVFVWNERSAGVLRKCGFEFEGRQRAAVFKSGRIGDKLMFAVCRPGLEY